MGAGARESVQFARGGVCVPWNHLGLSSGDYGEELESVAETRFGPPLLEICEKKFYNKNALHSITLVYGVRGVRGVGGSSSD